MSISERFFGEVWKSIKAFFINLSASVVLFFGVAFAIAGIAGAFRMVPESVPLAMIISAFSCFVGGFVVAGSLRRFVFRDKEKMEEVRRKNLELVDELKNEKDEIELLQHRLNTSPVITGFQPVMKMTICEIPFKYNDYYQKRLNEDDYYTKRLSRIGAFFGCKGKLHNDPEYYRGVYHCVGKMKVEVDFGKIKVTETPDAVMICGPFEYEKSIICDEKESEWKMQRREQEHLHGRSKEDMDAYEIEVTKTSDLKMGEKQKALLQDNLKFELFDWMKDLADKYVVERVKRMLPPTGKRVVYDPTAAGSIPTMTLGEYVAEYDRNVPMVEAQPVKVLPEKA